MKILIVGLGLIGGSLAKALSAYTDAKVVGMDKDDKTLALALDEGAIRYIAGEPDLEDADVTILCLTPASARIFARTGRSTSACIRWPGASSSATSMRWSTSSRARAW